MKHICSYFDNNYLSRGLALYQSIARQHEDFIFYVLAFDDFTFNYLTDLGGKNLKVISHRDYNVRFETSPGKYPDKKQYYFSATPNLCLYLLDAYPEIDILLYLDSDVYVFNSLDPLFEEFGLYEIGFTSHRISPILKLFVNHYGKYNIGVNLFRNSPESIKCLLKWKKDCESWYKNMPGYPLKFFSDQIFLDHWPELYKNIKVIENPGVNVVYWNVGNYKLSRKKGVYFIDSVPLIIYHFSTLIKIDDRKWNTNSVYGLASVRGVLMDVYIDYIKHIESFGLNNSIRVDLNHKETLKKRISHFILSKFFKEIVITD